MIKPQIYFGLSYRGLRIGLLGGSFNPAHEGHLDMSLQALKRLRLDQIWWLVSPQNPLKLELGMESLARRVLSARHMARHPKIRVSDLEAHYGTRYTVDTLRFLKRRFPGAHFVWLMGADNLRQIPRWKEWQALFKLVPVAVFRRPSYAAGRGLGKAAVHFNKFWRPAKSAKNLATIPAPAWLILDNRLNPASATALRNNR